MRLPRLFRRPPSAAPIEAARVEREPQRDTVAYPILQQLGQLGGGRRLAVKPTPRNLRAFARTPYARRAINAIKNPVAALAWEIVPIKGVSMSRELARQIEVATRCLEHPNHDDSFRTMVEAVVEDVLLGAAAIELQLSTDPLRPLWLYPTDGLTIQIYPGWSGNPDEARYAQVVGYGSTLGTSSSQVLLTNRELAYIRPNPNTFSPFGTGAMEVAFNSVSRILGVGDFAGNVATNSRPSIGLDMGAGYNPEMLSAFRSYWRNEVEGQGQMPVFGLGDQSGDGKARGPKVMRFYPEGDAGLYLKYQDFLKAEIATAFDLSPMNLGVERDVNRSTGEVSSTRDRDHAIRPMADLLASHLTRDALHGRLGFSQIEFRFVGLQPEDEATVQKILSGFYAINVFSPNEIRAKLGEPPSTSIWADQYAADIELAKQSARAGTVVDPIPGLDDGTPKGGEANA